MKKQFEFHIGELRSGRAEPRIVGGEASVDWHVELSRVSPDPPLVFEFELTPIAGGITLMGDIEATVVHRCHRCLTDWTEQVVHHVAQVITTRSGDAGGGDGDGDGDGDGGGDVDGDGDDEEVYHLRGDVFDFEVLIRDELILSLPMAPKCGPDCPGLVVNGGNDLNTNLSEDEAAASSPFSVLRDLLDNGD